MIIRDVKFLSSSENETLKQDYEDSLLELAEQLAICHAEIRKWEAFKHAAAQGLTEGMRLCEMRSAPETITFSLSHLTV